MTKCSMRQQMEAVKLEGDRDKAQLAAERERFAREREEHERKMRADGKVGRATMARSD